MSHFTPTHLLRIRNPYAVAGTVRELPVLQFDPRHASAVIEQKHRIPILELQRYKI